MALLEVEGLRTYFYTLRGIVRAVDGVSIDLRKGEVLGIAGESGCGKSTLAWSIMGIVPPPGRVVGGRIVLDGMEITGMGESELRRKVRWKRVSMIFQGAMNALTPVYTVGSQIMEVLTYHGGYSRRDAREKMYELLEEVGLERSLANRYPHELSGGQKQRVVIAMAIALEPDIVIADEPTTALDVVVQAQILNLLKKLQRDRGISIILITHDLGVIAELSERVAIMYAGKIVEQGSAEDIFLRPRHPYTHLLLRAIPRLRGPVERLEYIPGQPPDLVSPPRGCRFRPRCPFAMDVCRQDPELVAVGDGHYAACWLNSEGYEWPREPGVRGAE